MKDLSLFEFGKPYLVSSALITVTLINDALAADIMAICVFRGQSMSSELILFWFR